MKRPLALILAGAALTGGVWFFKAPLLGRLSERATLANDAPAPEVVAEMIELAADPCAALLAAWNSGGVVHRQMAMRSFSKVAPAAGVLPAELESLLLSAALDADMNVREEALGLLAARRHPALAALAAAQLRDCDQQVRALGINHLRALPAAVSVPVAVPLLDDADPLIVTLALKTLEKASGEKFGVNLSETAPVENQTSGLKEYRAGSSDLARAGAGRAKAWWAAHSGEFPTTKLELPPEADGGRRLVPAGDFELRTLEGRPTQLSEFKGKVVLLNFWTTWCPACLSEMPELIALQKQHADDLVILGVSLDYVPDSHGHIGGHAAVEEQGNRGAHDDHEAGSAALKRVREKVARTAKARGINYPVLLDERNEVGGRFNGGELPTTVIVDAEGLIRRRFIGARSLPVFEAMIAAARNPRGGLARN